MPVGSCLVTWGEALGAMKIELGRIVVRTPGDRMKQERFMVADG